MKIALVEIVSCLLLYLRNGGGNEIVLTRMPELESSIGHQQGSLVIPFEVLGQV